MTMEIHEDQEVVTKAEQAAFSKSLGTHDLHDPDELMQVVKVEPEDMGNPMIFRLDRKGVWDGIREAIQMLSENSEPGSRVIVTVDRMTRGDYAMLKEHQGW